MKIFKFLKNKLKIIGVCLGFYVFLQISIKNMRGIKIILKFEIKKPPVSKTYYLNKIKFIEFFFT